MVILAAPAAAAIAWQLLRIGATYVIKRVGSKAFNKAIKEGAKKVGKSGSRSEVNKKLASQTAKATKPKVPKKPATWSKTGEDIVRTPQVGGTAPWRKAGKFIKLSTPAVSRLSASQRKLYKTALKTWERRSKTSGVGRATLRAVETPKTQPLRKAARYTRAGIMKLGKYPTVRSGLFRIGQGGAAVYTGAQLAEMGYRKATTGKWSDKDGNLLSVIPFSETDWWSWKGGKKEKEKPAAAEKREAPAQTQTQTQTQPKAPAPPATLEEKHQIAKDVHGKHSKKAGRAWGAKHGIDISYDFPGMSSKEYQKGLDEGTISTKLGKTKNGKLTERAKEELEEKQYRRHGGSVSANNYKLRKKSSTAKSGRVSKKSSWNY